jgi:hypothetical protein
MNVYNRRKTILGLIAVLLLILVSVVALSITEENVLIAVNANNGDTVKLPLFNDEFVLGYIHSILLTPAEEYFTVVEDQKILLQKTIYESFGVGLPFYQENDSDFEIVDDKFILYLEREFEQINMFISPIPKHWISTAETRYELVDLATEEGARIDMHIEKRKVLKLGMILTYVF